MPAEIEIFLAGIGVEYHRWTRVSPIPAFSSAEEILKIYEPELQSYKSRKNFSVCNVVDLTPETPGLEGMLADFKKEHLHSSDEARFILAGRGICYLHPSGRGVITVELEPGDVISVGAGIRHWFELCAEKWFRAIQFSCETQEAEYTGSGIDAEYEPVCMGPAYFTAGKLRAVVR